MGSCDRFVQDRIFHRRPCHGQGLRPLQLPLRAATLPRVTRAAGAARQPRPPYGRGARTALLEYKIEWRTVRALAALPAPSPKHAPRSRQIAANPAHGGRPVAGRAAHLENLNGEPSSLSPCCQAVPAPTGGPQYAPRSRQSGASHGLTLKNLNGEPTRAAHLENLNGEPATRWRRLQGLK